MKNKKNETTESGAGWLAVSADGFAQQNMGRPKEHLVKELVQNSLDALAEQGRTVRLEVLESSLGEGHLTLVCEDDGPGIPSMENLRTVFWTSKQDSHTKRGRMGRGFKELLCLCVSAKVYSGNQAAIFDVAAGGEKVFFVEESPRMKGTRVEMTLPWEFSATRKLLAGYFRTFLPPQGVALSVLGELVSPRSPKHKVAARLTTECFSGGFWSKPRMKTDVELHRLAEGEEEGLIYEMGIPVCPVEWDSPYHVNILQRVPMNPNRDAVMAGYPSHIHRACLPVLIKEMDSDAARSGWVGEAAAKISDAGVQKEVLHKAFGDNLARSVPCLGKYDFDAEAEEEAGTTILDTRQLSGGFKELAKNHLQTSKDVAEAARLDKRMEAAARGSAESIPLAKRLGAERFRAVKAYYKWLSEGILRRLGVAGGVTVKTANFEGRYEGTWSDNMRVLTLAEELSRIWESPVAQDNFALIVHETAHELAAHHGRSFADAMEQTAGAACRLLFEEHSRIGEILGR